MEVPNAKKGGDVVELVKSNHVNKEVKLSMNVKQLVVAFSLFSFMFCISLGVASANAVEWDAGYIEAEGYGVPPATATSAVQGKLLARRGAIADAQRNLLELVSGVHINSETTVQDLMVKSDIVKTRVRGFVQGFSIKSEQQMYDGTYRVTLRVPLYGVQGLQTAIPEITPELEKVNPEISKIILEKPGDSAEIISDDVTINLNWYQQRKGSVKQDEKVDLDLGCFWEPKAGGINIIDPLNKKYGNYDQLPYIKLDHDDRSGDSLTGETLKMNAKKFDDLKRILVYSYIYKGVAKWAAIDGVITIKQPNKPDIIVKLDNNAGDERTCAVATIEKDSNGKLRITRAVQYFTDVESMDTAYNWGFSWHKDTKD